jgi:phosphonate transport system permease protein
LTASAPAAAARPPKPRPSLALPLGVVAFIVITVVALGEPFGIGLDVGAIAESFTRGAGILGELLRPNWAFLPRTVEPMVETFQIAVLGAVLGCGLALPVSFLASRVTAPNRAVFSIDRSVLSVLRAIPDVLWALLFVAAVGIGPLPGILALTVFNVGVVAKLLSETIDGIDQGPIEAARAAGGNRTQAIRWAVFPQVLPNYVAYSLYAFELNIRASAVLGFVGAGGIGNLIFTQYRFFNWSNVSVIVIELFVFVFLIELISIRLRRRLV